MLLTSQHAEENAVNKSANLSFLDLPPEVRLEVYSYLIPAAELGTINVAICPAALRFPKNDALHYEHETLYTSPILRQTLALEELTRKYGLHLLRILPKQIQPEVRDLMARATTSFHCPECFDIFLQHFSFGFGPEHATSSIMSWLRQIKISLDVDRLSSSPECQRWLLSHQTRNRSLLLDHHSFSATTAMTNEMARTIAREELKFARHTASLYTSAHPCGVCYGWKWIYLPAEAETVVTEQVDDHGLYSTMSSAYVKRWVIKGTAPSPSVFADDGQNINSKSKTFPVHNSAGLAVSRDVFPERWNNTVSASYTETRDRSIPPPLRRPSTNLHKSRFSPE